MKMLKVIAAMLAIMLLISGCGCAKNETQEQASGETNAAVTESQEESVTNEETPSGATGEGEGESEEAASDDGKISIDLSNTEKTPKYYWAASAEGDKNLLYHKEACPTLTEAATPINLGIAQSIGLRQCPECKPEKYEGYAE